MIKGKLYLRHLAYLGAERAIECENRRDRPSSQMDRNSGSHSATFIKQVSMWAVKDVVVNVLIDLIFCSVLDCMLDCLNVLKRIRHIESLKRQREGRVVAAHTLNWRLQ